MNLRLYIPQFVVCWSFGVAGFEYCPCCRLKHKCSFHVVCGGWRLMTVRNSGFISPGLCSGMSVPSR